MPWCSTTTLPSGSPGQSFLWELILTFFLMFVIMAVATDTRAVGEAAAIAVGGTVLLDAMFGGPISGASMNPARTLGPDIVSANFTGWWVYVAGDLIGAAIAVVIITLVRGVPDKAEREAAEGGDLPLLDPYAQGDHPTETRPAG